MRVTFSPGSKCFLFPYASKVNEFPAISFLKENTFRQGSKELLLYN
jgi:hypothetical protein